MATHHVCVTCGVFGVKRDLVNCANCCAYAIHRYCMIEWPNTKRGPISWFCGCQEHQDLPNHSSKDHSEFTVKHDEISNDSGFTAKDEDSESQEEITSECTAKDEKEVSNQSDGIKSGTNQIRQKLPTKFMKSFTSYGNLYGPGKHAEPIIRSIWSGSFQIRFMQNEDTARPVNGITAFLSNKVDEKAWDETVQFGPVIRPEMVLRDLVWPNGFEETGPKDEDIAVYFFSSLGVDEQVYDCLVFEMMRDDLAMRVDLEDAEILIFTSVDLIPRLRRFQGKWYLWGFFRQKHRSNDEHDSLSGPDLCSSS